MIFINLIVAARHKIKWVLNRVKKKVIENPLSLSFWMHITHNRIFKLIKSQFEDIRSHKILQEIKQYPIPHHLAIIMDGNRRFAKEQGMDTVEGHKLGGEKLGEVMEWCKETGIKILTVYAFSTENFQRSQKETKALMNLFATNFYKLLSEKRIHQNKIRIHVFGKLSLLPPNVQHAAQEAMESTKKYDSYFLNLAIGYGGREEIIHAIKKIAADVKKGELDIGSINTNIMSSYLYTSDLPDPDFVLRTSGEERLSNFLLWQLAYSELYFSDVYWPAFKKTDFLRAIRTYQQRQRRYGG